jgi:preprotein translocase subunit SecG
MYQVIIVIHVLLGLGVIGLVLMQQGKGADAGAAFGTGSAGSVFGAQGAASFLSRSTAILATLFFSTSLGLAVINGHKGTEQDLMAVPATEKTDSGLPSVQGAKTDTPPVTEPGIPTAPAAVVPPVNQQATPAPSSTNDKVETVKSEEDKNSTEQAKPADEPKPVAEKKAAETTKKAVEHKAPAKNKKAETEKHKDKKSH